MIRILRNDARIVRWTRSVRLEGKISGEVHRAKRKLNTTRKCF